MKTTEAILLAERLQATIVEAVLAWGTTMNRAEDESAAPATRQLAATEARLRGQEVVRLARECARLLRRTR